MTSWVEIIEQEEAREEDGCRRTPGVTDQSDYSDDGYKQCLSPESTTYDVQEDEEEEVEVLNLNYSDSDLTQSSDVSERVVELVRPTKTCGTDSNGMSSLQKQKSLHRETDCDVEQVTACGEVKPRCRPRNVRKQQGKLHRAGVRATKNTNSNNNKNRNRTVKGSPPSPPARHAGRIDPGDSRTAASRRSWNVRWVRSGFEDVVYYVCNCNEAPNVVFATLCFQQSSHVYTMVLRNCNCKRRYWFDKRLTRHGASRCVGDFERAISCRAKAIGRSWSAPGYDLASFVLQHVATDKRSVVRGSSDAPIVLVTTADMLKDFSIRGQLLYERTYRGKRAEPCALCRSPSSVVTEDSACIPTFTCWQHSSSQLAATSCDRTRLHGAIVLDLQFVRKDPNDELVCRLRLVKHDTTTQRGGVGVLTIAELVSLPNGVHPFQTEDDWQGGGFHETTGESTMDVDSAHSECCLDEHHNDEDLFPSMLSANGVGGGCTKHYDTTIGRLMDRLYCTASKFQKL